jgi:hypothetical protein
MRKHHLNCRSDANDFIRLNFGMNLDTLETIMIAGENAAEYIAALG